MQISQAQQDLHQQRRQVYLEAILENMPDGIIVQDMEGRIIMHTIARQLLGRMVCHPPPANCATGQAPSRKNRRGTGLGIHALDDTMQIQVGGKILGFMRRH